jgi:hypothetical protein
VTVTVGVIGELVDVNVGTAPPLANVDEKEPTPAVGTPKFVGVENENVPAAGAGDASTVQVALYPAMDTPVNVTDAPAGMVRVDAKVTVTTYGPVPVTEIDPIENTLEAIVGTPMILAADTM